MMTNVAIIGATGSLGRSLREELKDKADYKVTLFSRRAESLALASNEKSINGSATSGNDLDKVLADQDIVFVALSGDLPKMAREIVASMKRVGVARIVFVSSMGIYGKWQENQKVLSHRFLNHIAKRQTLLNSQDLITRFCARGGLTMDKKAHVRLRKKVRLSMDMTFLAKQS